MENRQRRKGQAERQGWTTRTAAWLTTSSTTSPTTSSTTSPTTSPTIFTIFKATTTKVAAFGRHHKRGGAAFGRATSFVVSFVELVNIVSIVAVNTELDLHLSQPGGLLGGRAVDRIYGSVP